MKDMLYSCKLCPRNCSVNRHQKVGFCHAPDQMIIARASLHFWEEPCLSGKKGSGTIFFSGCNLQCIYCQNYEISATIKGKEITIDKFKDICLNLQNKGANNINLVTPTMYIPLIVEGLKLAKKNGLTIPIVYNTSSYENVPALQLLTGLVDIYLPDLKYFDNNLAEAYSNAPDYFKVVTKAIAEMYHQVGKPKFNRQGLMTKGVIVRHLMLPSHQNDTKEIIKYLYETYHDDIYISIMNQYTPMKELAYHELNHKISEHEYDEMIDYAYDLGIRNAYVQDNKTQKKSFIPSFNNEGL